MAREAGQLVKAPSFETAGDWQWDQDGASYTIATRLNAPAYARTGAWMASLSTIKDPWPPNDIHEGSVTTPLWTGRPGQQHRLVFWCRQDGSARGNLLVELWTGSAWEELRTVAGAEFDWSDYIGFEVVFTPPLSSFAIRFTAKWISAANGWYLDDVEVWDAVEAVPPAHVPGSTRETMMAISSVQICNMALAAVGHGDTIASFEEDSQNARVCRIYYEQVRDQCLEDVDWRFASRRRALVKVDDSDAVTEWAYRYQYPTDCLVMREIISLPRSKRSDQRIPFAVESDADHGLVILTDQSDAIARYTAKVEDPSWWPRSFVDYLVYSLAEKLGQALRVDPNITMQMVQLAERAKGKAIAVNSRQGQKDADPDARHIAERTS